MLRNILLLTVIEGSDALKAEARGLVETGGDTQR